MNRCPYGREYRPQGGRRCARRVRRPARAAARCRASRSPCRNRRRRSADEHILSRGGGGRETPPEAQTPPEAHTGRGAQHRGREGGPGEPESEEPYFSLMQKLRSRPIEDRVRMPAGQAKGVSSSVPRRNRRRSGHSSSTCPSGTWLMPWLMPRTACFGWSEPPMPPIVHSDVFKLISRADADRGDIDPDFPVHRKSRGLSQGQRPWTMRGILWTLMHTARLHRLAIADGFSSSRGWLAAIEQAAEQFYLPPKSPGVGVPVHRPQELELGRSRETAGRRQAGPARVRRASCPSLLVRPRCERIRGQRQEQGAGSREGAHPGGPSDHRR